MTCQLKFIRVLLTLISILLISKSVFSVQLVVPDTGNDKVVFVHESDDLVFYVKAPREIVHSPDKGDFFVAGSNILTKINSLGVINEKAFGSEIRGINCTDNLLIGVLKNENKLFITDLALNSTKFYNLQGIGPRQSFIDEDMVYITCNESNVVEVFSLKEHQTVAILETDAQPYSIYVDTDNIYVGSITDKTVAAINKKTYELLWRTKGVNHPTKIVENDNSLYITNFDDNSVTILAKLDGYKENIIPGIKGHPFDINFLDYTIFVSTNKGSIYVFDEKHNLINVITGFSDLHNFQLVGDV